MQWTPSLFEGAGPLPVKSCSLSSLRAFGGLIRGHRVCCSLAVLNPVLLWPRVVGPQLNKPVALILAAPHRMRQHLLNDLVHGRVRLVVRVPSVHPVESHVAGALVPQLERAILRLPSED